MFCKKCGNKVNEGEEFCSRCGTPISNSMVNMEKGVGKDNHMFLWIILFVVSFVFVCCIGFVGGILFNSRENDGAEITEFLDEVEEVTTETEQEIVEPLEKEPNLDDVLSAYYDCISELEGETFEDGIYLYWSLIYVDDDDIPELVLKSHNGAQRMMFCYYYAGKVFMTSLDYEACDYVEKGGILWNPCGTQGYYYDEVFRFQDGKLTKIHMGIYHDPDESGAQFDDNGDIVYVYEWDGNEVTKDEYNQALDSVVDKANCKSMYDAETYEYEDAAEMLLN